MGRSGTWQKNLSGAAAYESFAPAPLPPSPPLALDAKALGLLKAAHENLASLGALTSGISDVDPFVAMCVRKDALMSSRIEGVRASLGDILDPSDCESPNVAEVNNLVKAARHAMTRLADLPLCNRLIRETHAALMENASGKTPGEFRRSQNWIGNAGSSPGTASYIPPSPGCMMEAMSRLESFMNQDDGAGSLDVLVRAALIHYQFEAIHPFLDGNGRVGRLLVVLFLMSKGVISRPALCISGFLGRDRGEYYDRLTRVRSKGDYEGWVSFFLAAIKESAWEAIGTLERLAALRAANTALVAGMGRHSDTIKRVLAHVEECPITDANRTAASLGISRDAAAGALNRLAGAGVLARGEKGTFSHGAYLGILGEGTVP